MRITVGVKVFGQQSKTFHETKIGTAEQVFHVPFFAAQVAEDELFLIPCQDRWQLSVPFGPDGSGKLSGKHACL